MTIKENYKRYKYKLQHYLFSHLHCPLFTNIISINNLRLIPSSYCCTKTCSREDFALLSQPHFHSTVHKSSFMKHIPPRWVFLVEQTHENRYVLSWGCKLIDVPTIVGQFSLGLALSWLISTLMVSRPRCILWIALWSINIISWYNSPFTLSPFLW